MTRFNRDSRIGDIVAARPTLASLLENLGIDYCCGGKKTLEEACREKGIDPEELLHKIDEAGAPPAPEVDAAAMTLSDLADHIEATHHAYLHHEMPHLQQMARKVAEVHGEKDPRLYEVATTVNTLAEELAAHLMKEEQVLFPMIRQLEKTSRIPEFHCGSLSNPIGRMEEEHEAASSALERLRELTDNYTPAPWACNTCLALFQSFALLERDLHQHIHKENNILFPKAEELEARRATGI